MPTDEGERSSRSDHVDGRGSRAEVRRDDDGEWSSRSDHVDGRGSRAEVRRDDDGEWSSRSDHVDGRGSRAEVRRDDDGEWSSRSDHADGRGSRAEVRRDDDGEWSSRSDHVDGRGSRAEVRRDDDGEWSSRSDHVDGRGSRAEVPSAKEELQRERVVVERIADAHAAHIRDARRYATGMADEASFLSEEGPRETEGEAGDEDLEAAAEAAGARAAAARTLLAWKRVRELEGAGDALAFGRITDDEGQMYIGRTTVFDGDEPVLVDWRAAAAAPFYRATPLEALGVKHRRHLHYTDSVLTNYSDELFDIDLIESSGHLRGEAALMATLAEAGDGRMKTVVATIQAEQDAVIRASERGPLLVQGGPGTGKTVVALHRAAYLLYADRAALAETGVLIVGPSPQFLTYISDVLPSLGESGVVSVTAERMHPGVLVDPDESPEIAALKGSVKMIEFIDRTVSDRQRRPKEVLVAFYGSRRVTISVEQLESFFEAAQRQSTHNAGHRVLRGALLDTVVEEIFEPGFESRVDIRRGLNNSDDLRLFMEQHWPVLSPEQALNDVFGSSALLSSAAAAADLTNDEYELLVRERTTEALLPRRRWFHADVPLLDELHHSLGDEGEAIEREEDMEHMAADSLDVFELADAAEEEEEDEDEVDLVDHELGNNPADVDHYDAWREGDEEGTWL